MLARSVRSFVRPASAAVSPRDPSYATLSDGDVSTFERLIGKQHVLTQDLDQYNVDWMKWYKGNSSCVLLPSSAEEISAILQHCYERRIAVVPQAGNTGLVGGSMAVHDEVVLSVRRLTKHFEFDPTTGVLSCSSGHVLEDLDERVSAHGFMMPFDLGAKGSCLIGGNLATCAGGIRLLRYGSLHAHVLGLTVVTPDERGSVVQLGSGLRKDNSSLHTQHLFLGSEGTLGVITHVKMTCVARPSSVQSAMLAARSFEDCRKILRAARTQLNEILSSFELLDAASMHIVKANLNLDNVLPGQPAFNLLLETSGSNEEHDKAKFDAFLAYCIEEGIATDGVLAQSAEEARKMWVLREGATLALTKDPVVYKFDVSVPLSHFYSLTEEVRQRLGDLALHVITYGHMGDGNSHLNVTTTRENAEAVYEKIYPFIYEYVVQHGGSVSAEHGIGRLKRPYAQLGKSDEERSLVRALKAQFDPKLILNPYKFM